jgi:hypothetical protein
LTTSHNIRRIPDYVRPALLGGLLSGLVGGLLFASAHAVLIVPIWSRMWSGLAWGVLAGVAAGWAMIEIYPSVVTTTPRTAAASGARHGALLWLLVTPVTLLDALVRALGIASRYELVEVAFAVVLAISTGAVFAWLRTGRWRATIAGALATLTLTVAMAGPVPIARSPRAFGIFVAVLPAATLAGSVLALVVRWLARRRPQPTSFGSE